MGAVNGLFRRGWKTSMMKAGDMVTVGGNGIADGDWATDARIAQQAVAAIAARHGG